MEGAMVRIAMILSVFLLATAAHAGGNPNVTIYACADWTGEPVHSIETMPYTTCSMYICLGSLEGSVSGMALRLTNLEEEYPGFAVGLHYYPQWPSG
jgi:hypothetical protein